MSKRKQSEVERVHGHCADELMKDYSIPREMRAKVCEEIAKVWKQTVMIHSTIIWSVRGYQPHSATRGLEVFLQRHARSSSKNHKDSRERASRGGSFDSKGYYHPAYADDDY
jgi:hypothetical protein